MRIPTVASYRSRRDSDDPNASVITDSNNRDWYYSYTTLVAFRSLATGLVVHKNDWSRTTGSHLNAIDDDHSKRVDSEEFSRLLIDALGVQPQEHEQDAWLVAADLLSDHGQDDAANILRVACGVTV